MAHAVMYARKSPSAAVGGTGGFPEVLPSTLSSTCEGTLDIAVGTTITRPYVAPPSPTSPRLRKTSSVGNASMYRADPVLSRASPAANTSMARAESLPNSPAGTPQVTRTKTASRPVSFSSSLLGSASADTILTQADSPLNPPSSAPKPPLGGTFQSFARRSLKSRGNHPTQEAASTGTTPTQSPVASPVFSPRRSIRKTTSCTSIATYTTGTPGSPQTGRKAGMGLEAGSGLIGEDSEYEEVPTAGGSVPSTNHTTSPAVTRRASYNSNSYESLDRKGKAFALPTLPDAETSILDTVPLEESAAHSGVVEYTLKREAPSERLGMGLKRGCVVEIYPNTPADRAQIPINCRIVTIDGTNVGTATNDAIVKILVGVGMEVTIGVAPMQQGSAE